MAVEKYPEQLVFGLDIGTRSIVGTVGYKRDANNFVVVAQASAEHDTRAMMDGQIHDIGKVTETIIQIKKKLEKMLGRPLKDVCIAAAGRVLRTIKVRADYQFAQETTITNEHIYSLDMLGVEKAYDRLREDTSKQDISFYCVGYSVIHYYQNDYPISNLEGHKANTIAAELIATFLPDEVVDGLYAAVEKAGLFVANLTLEPIAAINVAIPERFRLLNIALVDVGAGTSDISITNDGSIIAYGMIPYAGDEITECIAKHYLTDFAMAEKMKKSVSGKKPVTYKDIMGLNQKTSSTEIVSVTADTVKMITKNVAEKIIELNGQKTVSAVFIVGGGGKMSGFEKQLAKFLKLPDERVALRGEEVMGNIEFLQPDIKKDSMLVTPVGICMNFYEQNNNFIFVTVNGERVKLYDNGHLSIADAALQLGITNDFLFPRRGKPLHYTVNGEARLLRGQAGEAAVVTLNGKEAGVNTLIKQNDRIEIKESTVGEDAECEVGGIPEYHATITYKFNGKRITCPRFVEVNGELVSEFYQIQDKDAIEILDYYTLEQVLEFMDIVYRGNIYVNNVLAQMDEKVYDNFSIACEIKKEEPNYEALMKEYGEEQEPPFSLTREEIEGKAQREEELSELEADIEEEAEDFQEKDVTEEKADTTDDSMEENADITDDNIEENADTADGSIEEKTDMADGGTDKEEDVVDLKITVNDTAVVLKNKKSYILVDVLDFYPIDLSVARGNNLAKEINGRRSEFTDALQENDIVQIYWED